MTKKRVAVFGGAFNPPTMSHVVTVCGAVSYLDEEEEPFFRELIVVPCGLRPDKETVNHIDSEHRAAMSHLAFDDLPRVTSDLFDLDCGSFTRTIDLVRRYEKLYEVWLVVGSDLIQGGSRGESAIQRLWSSGQLLWHEAKFFVSTRKGFPIMSADLPPHAREYDLRLQGRSSDVRELIRTGQSIDGCVPASVANYIRQHRLYQD